MGGNIPMTDITALYDKEPHPFGWGFYIDSIMNLEGLRHLEHKQRQEANKTPK